MCGVVMTSIRHHTNVDQCGIINEINDKGAFIMSVIKSQFTLRLDLEDHAKIKKIAQKENRSMTNMIETLVKNEINQYENDNGEIVLTEKDIFLE